jgi:hypothetical protein
MNSQQQKYLRQPLIKMVVTSNQAQVLKVPTVQHKPIIKLTQIQLKAIIAATNQPNQIVQSSTVANSQNSPLSIEKACGLFNEVEFDSIEHSDPIENTTMEFNDLITSSNELTLENNLMVANTNANSNESKFAKKLNNLNMKLNLVQQPTPVFRKLDDSILDLKLTEDEWSKLITPGTEKLCYQFIQNNSAQLDLNECFDFDKLEDMLNLTPQAFNRLEENPFVNANSANVNLSSSFEVAKNSLIVGNAAFDHVYSSNDKRKASSLDEDTQDSIISSTYTNSDNGKSQKKQRTRGIYRLDDVTNEEEMHNYLERRKKNNVSSKVSRANKKYHYKEMDAKSNIFEVENERLRKKIIKLEEINKLIKDELMEKIVSK